MAICKALILVSLLVTVKVDTQNVYTSSSGSRSECKDKDAIGEMAGIGFDNLRNIEMEKVVETSYRLCRITEDGEFLVPDAVIVIPVKRSTLQSSTTHFRHYDNFTSTYAATINAESPLIGGKFSNEYKKVKTRNVFDHTETIRMQVKMFFARHPSQTKFQ